MGAEERALQELTAEGIFDTAPADVGVGGHPSWHAAPELGLAWRRTGWGYTNMFRARCAGVMAVKRSPEYLALHCAKNRPPTPDPADRAVSKRSWERGMQLWRLALKRCVAARVLPPAPEAFDPEKHADGRAARSTAARASGPARPPPPERRGGGGARAGHMREQDGIAEEDTAPKALGSESEVVRAVRRAS